MIVRFVMCLALLSAPFTANASPVLYSGEMVAKKVSGKACTPESVGKVYKMELAFDRSGRDISGFLTVNNNFIKLSGLDNGKIVLTYPFVTNSDGHTMVFAIQGDTLIGHLHEKHLSDDTIDDCNWDDAELTLSVSSGDAVLFMLKVEAGFNATIARAQGNVLYEQGKYAEAVSLYEKALALQEKSEGKSSAKVASYIVNLAHAISRSGDDGRAIALVEDRLQDFFGSEQKLKLISALTLFIHNKMGHYVNLDQYKKTIASINKEMEHISLENNTVSGDTLGKLAKFNSITDNYAAAEHYYTQAEKKLLATVGKENEKYIDYLKEHAHHYERYNKFADAERLYRQALASSPADEKSSYAEALIELSLHAGDTVSVAARCREHSALKDKGNVDIKRWLQGYCGSTNSDISANRGPAEDNHQIYSAEYQCNKTSKDYVEDLGIYGEIDAVSRKIARCYLESAGDTELARHSLVNTYPEALVFVDQVDVSKKETIAAFESRPDKITALEIMTDLTFKYREQRQGNVDLAIGNINRIINESMHRTYIEKYVMTNNVTLLRSFALNYDVVNYYTLDDSTVNIVSLIAGIARSSGKIDEAFKLTQSVYSRVVNLNERPRLMLAFNLFMLSLERDDYQAAIAILQNNDVYRLKQYLDVDELIAYGWAISGYQYKAVFNIAYKNDKTATYLNRLFADTTSRGVILEDLSAKIKPKLVYERCSTGGSTDTADHLYLEFAKNRFKVCRNGMAVHAHTTEEDILSANKVDGRIHVSTRVAEYFYSIYGVLLEKKFKAALGIIFNGKYIVKELPWTDEKESELKVGDKLKNVAGHDLPSETKTTSLINEIVAGLIPGQIIPIIIERNGVLITIHYKVFSTERSTGTSYFRTAQSMLVSGDIVFKDNTITFYDVDNLKTVTVQLDYLTTITKVLVSGPKLVAVDGKRVCSLDITIPDVRVCQTLSDSEMPFAIANASEYAVYDNVLKSLKYYNLSDMKNFRELEVGKLGIKPVSIITESGNYILYKHNEQQRHYLVDKTTGKRLRIRGNIVAFNGIETVSTFDNEKFTYTTVGTTFVVMQKNVTKTGISSRHLFFVTATGELFLYDKNGRQVFHGDDYGHLASIQSRNERVYLYLSDHEIRVLQQASAAPATASPLVPSYTIKFFEGGVWAIITPDGRFDTNNIEGIKDMHWVLPDDPLTPLPIEIFMKEYYEPRLLMRILNGDTFKPVRNLQSLNRVLPAVRIASVQREGSGDTVAVAVEVARAGRKMEKRGQMVTVTTGVHDLKLFRGGQLVDFREGQIELKKDGTQTITITNIRLPRKADIKEVEFSAYAFNDDGIKSLTSRTNFTMPTDITPAKGKAYLVNIGVNRYQNAAWNLQYAASDALKIRQSLEIRIPKVADYSDIIPITLTDELATKENIRAVFDILSGYPITDKLKQRIPGADKLAIAAPEDLLIISFSGHGYVDDNGIFYTFSHDTGPATSREVTPDLLARIISSDELSRWLRYVDAGDMAMIVDACHSAATVGDGFKPGPMGSRGLGQLAYDKGMRILAASQADDVALESDKLQQGLLTYSIVHDGLDAFQADYKPTDKSVTLSELLSYAVDRVPKLYEEVKNGNLSTFGRGEASRATVVLLGDNKKSSLRKKNPYQTPALFDFTRKQKGDVAVAGQ